MAITYRTVTGNLADLLRTDFDPASVRITVRTNLDPGDAPVDETNSQILLGTGRVIVASDGTFSTTNVIDHASTDVNPTGIQYRWDIDYTPRNGQRVTSWSSGFVNVTADADLATLVATQYVPPSYQSAFIELAEGYLARQEQIAGLANSDAAQAYNVEHGPLTGAALSATTTDIVTGQVAPVSARTPKPTVVHPAGLARWMKARGRAMFQQVRVLIEGDSITVGANANNAVTFAAADQLLWALRGFAAQTRRLFQSTYGDVGEGWVTFGADEGRWTYTGTTSASPAGPIGTGKQINNGGTVTAAALGGGSSFSVFDLMVYHVSGASVPRVSIDTVDKTPTKLSTTQDAFAVGASDWANVANTSLAHTTVSGKDALAITATASNNLKVQTPLTVGNGIPVTVGDSYMIDFEMVTDAASVGRAARAGFVFYDAGGTQLASSGELTTTDVTTVPGSAVTANAIITVPAGAVYASAVVRVTSAVNTEIHRVTRLKLIPLVARVVGVSSVTLYRFTITGLADTDHAVSIVTGPSGNIYLDGAIIRRDTSKGVVVHRVGKSGSTTGDHVGTQYSGGAAGSTATNMRTATYSLSVPDLVVLMLGANDIANQLSNGITPAVFKTNLKTLTDAIAAVGGCTLLMAGPRYATEVGGGSTQAAYYAKMTELANEETHVAFIDLGGEMWINNATANGAGYMNNGSYGIHPTLEGHGDLARAVHSILTRPYAVA